MRLFSVQVGAGPPRQGIAQLAERLAWDQKVFVGSSPTALTREHFPRRGCAASYGSGDTGESLSSLPCVNAPVDKLEKSPAFHAGILRVRGPSGVPTMNKKWTKQLFKGTKPLEYDCMTAKELLHTPMMSIFSAKLYVSHFCPAGCLRIQDEEVIR